MKNHPLLSGKQILFFDGAMGTMLQNAGLRPGEAPDIWNATHPDIIQGIHQSYLRAGCHILKTNTFGCNRYKLKNTGYTPGDLAQLAVSNARAAIQASACPGPHFIALDIGPSGKLLQPLGDLCFDEAYELFREPLLAGEQAGADLVLIETMSDTYELKAAVLAAKENTRLPVFATVTLDQRGKLLTGGDVSCVIALLEGLGVDALGFNCGLGPKELFPFLQEASRQTSLPLILNPNAGLPKEVDGQTVFTVQPEEFSQLMEQAAPYGAWFMGGCCGTTPSHIAALVKRCQALSPTALTPKHHTVAASYSKAVFFGNGTATLIGERINPTGKPRLKQALREKNYDYILQEALRQEEQGVHTLDVNAGLPEIDEAVVLPELLKQLQSVTDLPLVIDTADPSAMEQALRYYNGKAIINSVNGKASSMEAIFPLVKRYGGLLIALTLDENGIPENVEGRLEIARRILKRGAQYGIPRHAFLFDPLTMAISAGPENACITLECVRKLKSELHVKTSLGVSNISFGLPRRDILNANFFALALGAGLDAAILNPHASGMMDTWRCCRALLNQDPQCGAYIASYSGQSTQPNFQSQDQPTENSLFQAVFQGLRQQAQASARQALEHSAPLEIMESQLIPALNLAGERFEKGSLFLPQLLMCAEAAKSAFEILRTAMGKAADQSHGTVVLATVQGDVHDIGKNIVKALLENYRFHVIDLGKDVPVQSVVDAAISHQAQLVGLSALMTTTVPNMAATIQALHQQAPGCKVMCGGAVLTADYAQQIGADQYCPDAMVSVRYAQQVYGA